MPSHISPFASLNVQSVGILELKGFSPHHYPTSNIMAVIKEEKTKNLLLLSSHWPCLAPVEDKMQLIGLWGTIVCYQ